jgi:hypothetical protein
MRLFTLGLLLLLGWTVNAQIVENIDSPNWGLDEYDGVGDARNKLHLPCQIC